jgi:dTMP kinase
MFITLEGGEGSGKSSVAAEIAQRLESAGRVAIVTQEPTGTELGRRIWEFFQEPDPPAIAPLAELLLFEAARAQHVEKVIRPALALGTMVICDRFADSSLAYQGYGRGLAHALVECLNHAATGGLRVDLTLLLDVPVEIGLERARRLNAMPGAKIEDAIGEESSQFHLRVREGFQEIARANPERIVIIDAARPLDEVIERTWQVVERTISTH